jgi:hypothetical protein
MTIQTLILLLYGFQSGSHKVVWTIHPGVQEKINIWIHGIITFNDIKVKMNYSFCFFKMVWKNI